jgi:hypothetical protein
LIRFILSLLATSIFLYGISRWLYNASFFDHFPSYFWQTLIFLNVATIAIYYYLVRFAKTGFVQFYLLSMVFKLLAYSIYNVIIILQDRPNAGVNVGFFMITYVLFTALELVFMYRKISH